ncbi:MAG TPA: GTPase, partial [Thermomicrobiaceae bacterium]|nr:GTPase [Thermomicrobiaceae bacterium]
ITLRGIPATLLDTAGIAETEDIVERIGIDRSRRALESAGLAVLVLDGSQPPTEADRAVVHMLAERLGRDDSHGERLVVALNKRDLPEQHDHAELLALLPGCPVVGISTRTGTGLARLEEALYARLAAQAGEGREPALVTLRQQQALARALASTRSALGALNAVPLDLVAVDVRDALLAVGEITGEQIGERVLDEIFSRFCIGK